MKKSLAVILSTTMALSAFSSAALAASSSDFSDLSNLSAADKAIFDKLIADGVFLGTGDGKFGVYDNMLRSQFAVAISKALKLDATATTTTFEDVDADAPELPYIEAARVAGVANGTSATTFNPSGEVTKEELAVFLVGALGASYKDEASKATGSDPSVSDWAQGYVATALKYNLLSNDANGTFGGQAAATRYLLAKGTAAAQAIFNKTVKPVVASVSAAANADDTVTVMGRINGPANAVQVFVDTNPLPFSGTVNEDGTFTYTSAKLSQGDHNFRVVAWNGELSSDAATAAAKVVFTKLAVESVTIVDANHIAVKFNRDLTETSAETIGNYKLGGGSTAPTALTGPSTAEWDATTKTVTVTLATALTNNQAYTFAVAAGLQDYVGTALGSADYNTGLYFADSVKPAITSVASSGNGDIKITFSERVAGAGVVVVNGITVTANAPVDNTVTVTKANLAAAGLENGKSYSVYVSNYTDLVTGTPNAMDLFTGTVAYTVSADVTAPAVASVVVKNEKTLTLTFTEEVVSTGGTAIDKTGLVDNSAAIGLTVTKGAAATAITTNATTTDGKVFTVNLDATANVLYNGLVTPKETSAALAVKVNAFKDLANNVGASSTTNVTVVKDQVKPAFVNTTYDFAASQIVVNFTEGLAADAGAAFANKVSIVDANGVLKKAAGVTTGGLAVAAGDKAVKLDNGVLALAAGTYTLNFTADAVTDQGVNGGNTSAAFSTTVVIPSSGADAGLPTVSSATSGALDTITVVFSEAVKGGAVAGSATDVNNYKMNGAALPAGTFITLDGTKTTATISMPAGSVTRTETRILTVANVQDLAGNVMASSNQAVALTDSVAPKPVSIAYDAATGAILVTFSEDVDGKFDSAGAGTPVDITAADIVVKVNGVTVGDAAISASTDDKVIKITSAGTSFATGQITVTTVTSPTAADGAGNTLEGDVTVTLR